MNEVPTFRADQQPYGGLRDSGNTRGRPALRRRGDDRGPPRHPLAVSDARDGPRRQGRARHRRRIGHRSRDLRAPRGRRRARVRRRPRRANGRRRRRRSGRRGVRGRHGRVGRGRRVVRRVRRAFGGVDIAFLNAGISIGVADLATLSDDDYYRMMRVNVDGVVFGLRAAIRAMEARGGGAIVATSSLAGLIPFPPDPVYDASKHAVVGLIRSVAPTLAAKGITANTVNPGITDTNILTGRRQADAARGRLPDHGRVADRRRGVRAGDDRVSPGSAGSASPAANRSRTSSATCPAPRGVGAEGRRLPSIDSARAPPRGRPSRRGSRPRPDRPPHRPAA